MWFPNSQAAYYEQKKRELHAKLDQAKKVSLATVSLVWSRLFPQEVARRLSNPSPTKKPRPNMQEPLWCSG